MPTPLDASEIEAALGRVLDERTAPDVCSAYLFGSLAEGRFHRESDALRSRPRTHGPSLGAERARSIATLRGMGTPIEEEVTRALRRAGAAFAFLHGSRVSGGARSDSDLDVAAWWGGEAPPSWEVDLPSGVDLLVLDSAPLELAGRVALHGRLLFDDDPPARVHWQARTRLVYLDEEERQRRVDEIFYAGRSGRRGG